MNRKEPTSRIIIKFVIAIIIAIYVLFPLFLVLINSMKTTENITANPIGLKGVSFGQLLANLNAVVNNKSFLFWPTFGYSVLITVVSLVLLALFGFGKSKKPTVPIYLAGANTGDNRTYYGSMQKEVAFSLRNWYMEKYFGEHKMNLVGDILCVAMLVVGIGYMIATLVSLMGGVM